MEKKIARLKHGFQLILLVFLLASCRNVSQLEKIDSSSSESGAKSSDPEINKLEKGKVSDFKSSITDLRTDLEGIRAETPPTADISKVIASYKQLGSDKLFLVQDDQAVFDALESLGTINFDDQSEAVKKLQQALTNAGHFSPEPNGDPSVYGDKTNEALITYLKEIEQNASDLGPSTNSATTPVPITPSPERETQTASNSTQTDRKMPYEIFIPSLLGVTLLGVLGGLTFWIWKLGQRTRALDYSQRKLTAEINNFNQTLRGIETQNHSVRNSIHQLTERLANQEISLTAFAQESQRTNKTSPQGSDYQSTSYGAQPRPDSRSTPMYQPNSSQHQAAPAPSPPAAYLRLVKQYNQSPNSLAAYAAGVSQTEESLKLNLQDSSQTSVVLAQDNSPNYWIVRSESDDLWLFPKAGWEPSIGTLESFVKLFTFSGNPSKRYQVVKPALVIETGQRDWRLKELGEIEFS